MIWSAKAAIHLQLFLCATNVYEVEFHWNLINIFLNVEDEKVKNTKNG